MTYENGTVTDYQSFGYDEHGRTSSVTEKFGCNEVKDSYTYNETNGLVTSVTQQYHAGYKNSTNTFSYSYDHLKRADSTTVAHDGKSYSVNYRYANNLKDSAYTSNLISRKSYGTSVYESDAYKFDYVYDRVGNIKTATVTSKYDSDYVYTVRYGYDEQNQLVSERCAATNRAYVYEYDTYGNIRSKKTYTYGNYASPSDIAANCTLLSTDVYEYDDYEWFDLLTEYNNVPFSHDIIGNPLTYYNGKNYTFTWQNGRQMATASVNGTSLSFEYDIDGLRTKKTVQNGETYNYYYSGSKLHAMTWENGAKMLSFLYDSSGAPYSMVYCYTESGVKYSSSYYYVTNLQGDVVALMNANHEIVAEYLYDACGNILSITNASGTDISGNATHIANLNPLRYRGYVYDTETGFYYLQSRYYDPVVGRFVNLDGFVTTGTGFLGHNMYAYCNNNPVNAYDPGGTDAILLQYKDGAGGFGHIGLLIQDKQYCWHYFYWGGTGTLWDKLKGPVKSFIMFDQLGYLHYAYDLTNYNDVVSALKKYSYCNTRDISYYEGLTDIIYYEGDFSKSCMYINGLIYERVRIITAEKITKGFDEYTNIHYNLYKFNCMHFSLRALLFGRFAKKVIEKNIEEYAYGFYIPNKIFNKLKK